MIFSYLLLLYYLILVFELWIACTASITAIVGVDGLSMPLAPMVSGLGLHTAFSTTWASSELGGT